MQADGTGSQPARVRPAGLIDAFDAARDLAARVERPGARRVLKVSAAGACGDAITVYLPGCNLACVHCWAGADREDPEGHGRFRTFGELRAEIRRFRRHNRIGASARNLRLSGGEPILSEAFFDLLEGLLPLPGTLFVETNGVILGAHTHWVDRLVAHGARVFFKISIKAGTAAQFARITGCDPAALEASFAAVRSLWAAGVPLDTNSLCRAPELFGPDERAALLDRLAAIDPRLAEGHEAEELTAYPHTLRRMRAPV